MKLDYSKMSTKALEDMEKNGGDPKRLSTQTLEEIDALRATAEAKAKPIGIDEAEATGRGYAQGYTFGLQDEISGLIKSPMGAGKKALGYLGMNNEGDKDVAKYEKQRDLQRQLNDAAQQEQATAYNIGDVAGSLLNPAPGAVAKRGVGMAAKGLNATSKTGKYLQGVGKVGTAAAGEGALRGLGHSEAKDTLNLAADVGMSSVAEGVTGSLFKGGTDAIKRAGAGIENLAGKAATSALGRTTLKEDDKIRKMFDSDAEYGKFLQDKGIVHANPFKSPGIDGTLERVTKAKKSASAKMGNVLRTADNLVEASGKQDQLFVSADNVLTKAMDEILPGLEQSAAKSPEARKMWDILNTFDEKYRGKKLSFQESYNLKKEYDDIIYGLRGEKSETIYLKELTKFKNILNKEIDQQVALVGAESKSKGLLKKFKEGKKGYGEMAVTEKIAQRGADAKRKNNAFGLTDMVIGAGGLAGGTAYTGDPVTGAAFMGAGMVGRKVTRDYGNQAFASLLRKIGKGTVNLGKFGATLEDAARRGTMELAATHNELMKDPEYRQTIGEE